MDKKISELDQALQINNDAVFPISQNNGGTDTTYKVSITQISAEVGEDQTFSNLDTTDKTLVGAINEIAQGGGGGGSSTLAGLTDVDIDDQTLSDGQVLKYDSVEEKWKNDDVGAGGHTIVADDGTDLAQRANLQFIGAYSEDNSTDDTTEVNVVREMTKAEFDELTEAEKTGLINITDITGGNDDRFQPVIYSTEEREIGVWIDGKPLYEKTYHNSAITIASNTELTIDDFSDKFPVNCCGVMHNSTDNRTYYPNWTYTSGNIYYRKNDSGNLVLRSESDSWGNTWEVFTVVRYTKDSDTAGSGQWTPQGVPAHHYSEDEQVVGTWIDGSTLYEKVFDLGSELSISRSSWTATTITGVIQTVNAFGIGASGSQYPLMSRVVNNTVDLLACRDGENAYCQYIYLRYTKSV